MPAPKLRSFQDTLSAAIDDFLTNGFDSMERVERWKRALVEAANRQIGDPILQAQRLKDALGAIYKRQIDDLQILRYQKGDVPRYTIDKLRPQLHAELDRRLRASASLIVLKRDSAIASTMQRWEGWATSIPPGGVSAETRRAIKKNVGKSLKQLPFEERRVAIDQGHKMVAALSEIIAADGGAIAVIWHSHWRQAGYDYREDHKERDLKVYLIRDSWAHQAGLVKRGKVGYYDEVTAFGQEVFCRCYGTWLYALRDLPVDMLTQKGRRMLTEVGMHTNATRAFTRTDDVGEDLGRIDPDGYVEISVSRRARAADQLGYFNLVKWIRMTPDTDQWHASEDGGVVTLESKFNRLPPIEQLHVLLHEAGHAGQDGDRDTWQDFLRLHGDRVGSFESMANPTHIEDFQRTGHVDGGLASEVFAESYARWCLGMEMPTSLRNFWLSRLSGKMPPTKANYIPWWSKKNTRCIRCTMFEPGLDPRHNSCTAVAGDIAMQGHCRLFEIKGARTDSTESVPEPLVGYAAHRRRLERVDREIAELRALVS